MRGAILVLVPMAKDDVTGVVFWTVVLWGVPGCVFGGALLLVPAKEDGVIVELCATDTRGVGGVNLGFEEAGGGMNLGLGGAGGGGHLGLEGAGGMNLGLEGAGGVNLGAGGANLGLDVTARWEKGC